MYNTLFRKSIGAILFLTISYATLMMVQITLPYFSFRYDIDFLLTKQNVLHLQSWRYSFYIHIATGSIVLFTGLLQFTRPILKRWPKLHHLSGKIYVLLVLAFCAPAGLIIGFKANGGILAIISFVVLAMLWWYFTWMAYKKIRKGNISSHIAFMTKSYALTLSAVTFRTYVLLLPLVTNFHGKEMYVLISWLSWVPNLLIAEWINRRHFITAE